jgi:hypothetical protein
MNDDVRKEANLKLLKRTCNSNIQDILATSTHVVLYEYTSATAAWTKLGVEGSLFLTRSSNNSFDCIILNRNTPTNFTLSVSKEVQVQHQAPYLIIKVPVTAQVLGIWFPSAEERQEFYTRMQSTVERLRAAPTPPVISPATIPASQPVGIDHEATALLASKLLIGLTTGVADIAEDNGTDVAAAQSPTGLLTDRLNTTNTATTPTSVASSSLQPPRHGSPAGAGVALDKKSLQLALLSLIQDDRFLDLLHSQYLRVMHARAKTKREGN